MIPIFKHRLAASIKCAFTALTLFVMCAGVALAQQETGQISGTVSDPNSALVAGATVTVKSVDTGAERTVTTGSDGNYIVTNLQPGVYEVTANASGFQATQGQRVQVTVGGRPTLDVQFGQVTSIPGETVEVVGSGGVEINTQDQQLSDVVSSNQVRNLPTVTRNPYDLVGISGNVSENSEGGQNTTGGGAGFNINGLRAASTSILLDGAENVNNFSATIGQAIPLDAVQEFRVITSNFSAEYGRASGGIVNVATIAGGNDFNGSAYIFNRISKLASNGFDNNARGIPRGVFTRNQFGYAVSGPVVRNKLFFSNSLEFTRVRSGGTRTAFVLTPEFLAASGVSATTRNFINRYTLAATPTGRTVTAGSQGITGIPSSTPLFQEVQYSSPRDLGGGVPENSYSLVGRVDYNLSERTQLYGRYALEDQAFAEGTQAFSPYAGFSTGSTAFNQNALVNLTHQFTPNFISQTKLAFNRLNGGQPLGEQPPGPTLYINGGRAVSIGGINIAFPGYLPFNPGSAIPFSGAQNSGQVNQDFNYSRGKQNFRFGGQYVYIQDNRTFGAYLNSVQALGNTTTEALNNLVSGNIVSFSGAIDPGGRFPGQDVPLPVGPPNFSRSNRYNEFAIYGNDAIRIHPRVTMNLGLRYEYYGVQQNKDPNLDANFYYGDGANIFEQIRNGRGFRTPESSIGKLYRPDKNNFAPRFGLAWDVFGDGKTSLRGGYGVAYERNFGNVTFNVLFNPPNFAIVSLTANSANGAGDVASLPIFADNAGPFGGTGPARRLGLVQARFVDNNITNAYAHFYSVAFEHQLARNTVASVEYSGSAGRDLYSLTNINRPQSGTFYLGSRTASAAGGTTNRLNGSFATIFQRGNLGFSNYNGLTAALESNNFRSTGLTLSARYTFSNAKDNLSNTFSSTGQTFFTGFTDSFDPRLDYGNADFDVRHRFVGTFNYEIPFFNNVENRFVRELLGGFSINGIVNVRTGQPFTVFDCTNQFETCARLIPSGGISFNGTDNPSPTGNPNQFTYIDLTGQTARVPGNPVTGNYDFGPYPANMTTRNAFRSPGFYNIDLALYKRIRITEGTSLQLRAEVFNVLNHANLFVDYSGADVSSSDFVPAQRGLPFASGVLERRNVQLAAKFIF
ncbi:MAG: carboxypeptidase regulatory-like domain-containing protein [Pyrinomonadaceae bacterium]|nr:carboxypeptidase regulatory-like domain-containing protein [Pyrinomonadaceae bacterium]